MIHISALGHYSWRNADLQIRTVAAILMMLVVTLLFLNIYLRSGWIWLMSIALMIIAVIVYFIPTLRE